MGPIDFKPGIRDACHHAGVVLVGDQRMLGMHLMRVTDHTEKGSILALPVDDPVRIENLVSAVLRVDLSEHDQFHISGIARHPLIGVAEIVDFLFAQRQPHGAVRVFECHAPPPQEVICLVGSRF